MKKTIILLLILSLVFPQVFIFSASAEEDYTIDLSSPYDELLEERFNYKEEIPEFSDEIKSKDGKYGYVLNEGRGIFFSYI